MFNSSFYINLCYLDIWCGYHIISNQGMAMLQLFGFGYEWEKLHPIEGL